MTEQPDTIVLLTAYFDPRDIQWRIASTTADKSRGQAVAYIDARTVMERLDEAVGPANWQDEYTFGPAGAVLCRLSLRIDGEWITKSDGAELSDVEPVKGGVSDALKRAAVKWGIGRYLYALPAEWLPIVSKGKSYQFADGHHPRVPAWALPGGKRACNAGPSPDTNTSPGVFNVPKDSKGHIDWAAVWRVQPLGIASLAVLKERSGDNNAHRWTAQRLAEWIASQS